MYSKVMRIFSPLGAEHGCSGVMLHACTTHIGTHARTGCLLPIKTFHDSCCANNSVYCLSPKKTETCPVFTQEPRLGQDGHNSQQAPFCSRLKITKKQWEGRRRRGYVMDDKRITSETGDGEKRESQRQEERCGTDAGRFRGVRVKEADE